MTTEQMSFGGIVTGAGILLCIASFVGNAEWALPIGMLVILSGVVIEAVSQHTGMRG